MKRYVMFIKVITYSILGSTHFIRIYHVNSVKIQVKRSSMTTKYCIKLAQNTILGNFNLRNKV